jgi:hypothetical protein
MSSLNEISPDQLVNRVVRGEALLPPAPPLSTAGCWTYMYLKVLSSQIDPAEIRHSIAKGAVRRTAL